MTRPDCAGQATIFASSALAAVAGPAIAERNGELALLVKFHKHFFWAGTAAHAGNRAPRAFRHDYSAATRQVATSARFRRAVALAELSTSSAMVVESAANVPRVSAP